MKKLMCLSAASVVIASLSHFALTRPTVARSSLGVPLSVPEMRATVGGTLVGYQCVGSANCPYYYCPDPPGIVKSTNYYPVCAYTGGAQYSCENNATYYCNLDHYNHRVCYDYWHTDLVEKSKCLANT